MQTRLMKPHNVSYEHDSLALDAATRINDMLHIAFRDGWPEVMIKAAIQVEVINALQGRGVK